MLSYLMSVVLQSTQNNNYVMFLLYLKKGVSDEVDFLNADKHQSFLKAVSIYFDGFDQAFSKYPEKLTISLWYCKKEVRNEDDFWHAGKHEFNTVIFDYCFQPCPNSPK